MKLELQGIKKSFDGTEILHGINFSVEGGSALGLLGRNGAGKTTLFDLVYGRLEPLSGMVLWNGIDVTGMKAICLLYTSPSPRDA